MKLTHFGHSCVLLESEDSRILIDPGLFSTGFEDVPMDAILVTHRHLDHFDGDRIAALLEKNPGARLWVELSTPLEHSGIDAERVVAVQPGQTFWIKGTQVLTLGGTHGAIHPDL